MHFLSLSVWTLVFRSSPPACIGLCFTFPLHWLDYDSCVCSAVLCCSSWILCVPAPVPPGYLVRFKLLHFSSVLSLILFWLPFFSIPAFCWLHFDFWEISALLIKLPFCFITCLLQCLQFGSFSKKKQNKKKNEQVCCTFSKHITFQWLDIQYRVVSDTDYDFFQMAW